MLLIAIPVEMRHATSLLMVLTMDFSSLTMDFSSLTMDFTTLTMDFSALNRDVIKRTSNVETWRAASPNP